MPVVGIILIKHLVSKEILNFMFVLCATGKAKFSEGCLSDNHHPSMEKGNTVQVPISEIDKGRRDAQTILDVIIINIIG